MKQLTIGLDLDHTVYGFPEFFKPFIEAMTAAGHKIVCTSNHLRKNWPKHCEKLRALGINPDLIDPSLLYGKDRLPSRDGPSHKGRMADRCDFVFDDHADVFQQLTKTPVFKAPKEKAADRNGHPMDGIR
jgi:hypothetical protein